MHINSTILNESNKVMTSDEKFLKVQVIKRIKCSKSGRTDEPCKVHVERTKPINEDSIGPILKLKQLIMKGGMERPLTK